jgi:hypothetical protein
LQRLTKIKTGRMFSSRHTTPGVSFAAALRSDTQQQHQAQPPSVAQAYLAIVGEMSVPLPWGATNKKQPVSQFSHLMQTTRLWKRC